ncbi:MAG: serine hydrolase [Candidatus Bathyarchaeota archaeon]|nr:serine hydrolase [Candidatus Bathyarchaeota archaeon]
MTSELPDGFTERFEAEVAAAMTGMHIPGMSVSIVKDGSVIYTRGFGARNLERNLPATPDTLYGIGSCTKSFTALAIMQLAEKGKLDVQDPVRKHLPFKLGSKENPIRICHLLSMSSGIPNLGLAEVLLGRAFGVEEKWVPASSFDDLMLHINSAEQEIAGEPGTRYFYFNAGFTLLGEIVTRVSKMPYEQYIKQSILKPLKMNRSTFLEEQCEKDTDTMTAYRTEGEAGEAKVVPSRHPFDRFIFAPGGLLSSTNELTSYLLANINQGSFEDARILDASLMKEMHKIQLEVEALREALGNYGEMGYGYGWLVANDFLGHKLVMHGGSTGVSSAQLMFIPDLKIGIAAAANTGQTPMPVLIAALAAMMGKDPEKEIPDFGIEKRLRMLVGEYETYKGINKVSVKKKAAQLYVESQEWGRKTSYPLVPETAKIEDYKFHAISGPGRKTLVEFVLASSGKIDLYIDRNRFHKIR